MAAKDDDDVNLADLLAVSREGRAVDDQQEPHTPNMFDSTSGFRA